MTRSGKCLCGAVSYTATFPKPELSACHCGMCRRWASGALLSAIATEVSWQGEDKINTFKSSAWAERGFCSLCGSVLFYRITKEGPYHGTLSLTFGTLDDQTGFTLSKEWFIDNKPDAYTFTGECPRLTSAEIMAQFGSVTE